MDEHTTGRDPVSEPSAHLTAENLEQLAEGILPEREAADARTHIESCGRCASELDVYRQLFMMLGDLPRFAPSPAFADAVMTRVRLAPRESPMAAWLRRLVPSTRRGWVLLGTIVTAPVTPFIALAAWLMVQPLVTPTLLWQWLQIRAQAMGESSVSWFLQQTFGPGVPEWTQTLYSILQAIPGSAFGIAAAVLAIGIPLSAWGLHRLTRLPVSRVTYAN
jgi:hypothetical protein